MERIENGTYIALKCFAIIDGKHQDDVTAVVEGFSQEAKVFLLSGPGALSNVPIQTHQKKK